MSALDDLIQEIADEDLRRRIEKEIATLKGTKKFGLVFEPQNPECTPLYDVPVKKKSLVALKAGKLDELYRVTKIVDDEISCVRVSDGEEMIFNEDEVISVAQFGDAIYPYLQPLDTVCNAPDSSLWHALIEADNYHALQLLKYLYGGKVDCIYIDPPYNTGARDWKYNNDYVDASNEYRHSKWLSMMERRLKLAKELLNPRDSVLIVTIDEHEYLHLGCLLEEIFRGVRIQMITTMTNKKGQPRAGIFSRCEEYIFIVFIGAAKIIRTADNMLFASEKEETLAVKKPTTWCSLLRGGTGSNRKDRPNLFYPVFVNESLGKIISVGEPLSKNADRMSVIAPDGQFVTWPMHKDGTEGRWQIKPETLRQMLLSGTAKLGQKDKTTGKYAILYPFQMKAVHRLRDSLYDAQSLYKRRNNAQVISFTAPTGAGKTIMLAALVERVYRGDGNYPAQPDAIFVWLSDSPELNQQSCDKFFFNADGINHSQLFIIEDDSFDQQTLDDGKIYFLNTQKLGKGSNLTKHSDSRQYTIWETLRNTIKAKTDKIYFIIDEAHRGMKDNAAARATTIMQKFIKGSADDKFEPVPVVIGMSATPARFNNLVAKSSATIHRVVVETEEVKASGLLKERIIVIYPDEQASSAVTKDMAILEAASDEWKNKCEHWQQYLGEQNAKNFNPIFVVQVANGSGGKTSDTNLDECLKKISQRTGISFEVGEVVHTFGETADLMINGLQVQYRNPSSISGDDKIRVVFFKENLSTGWDCPQAETMMSFRRAVDATYIAQLLGRMIRTPMRRHIEVDDTLNEVRLYLPYFDKGTVQEIVRELQQSEGEAIPTEVIGESLNERKIDTLTVKGVAKIPARSLGNFPTVKATGDNNNVPSTPSETQPENLTPSTPETFHDEENFSAAHSETPTDNFALTSESTETKPTAEISAKKISSVQDTFDREKIVKAINAMGLLTYEVRSERINDYLKSLFQMAHFLTRSLLSQSAFNDVLDEVAAFISNHIGELKAAGEYEALYRQAKEFRLSAQVFDAFGDNVTQIISQDLFVTTDTDIERQFRQAEAVLKNEGVSNRYLRKILEAGDDIEDGKIDVILFVANHDCLVNLERFAKTTFHELCDEFRRKTVTLPPNLTNEYNSIVWNGDKVSKYNFFLPATISMPHDVNGKEYSDHLFVNETTGTAKIKLDGWEEGVLREEQQRKDFVCWLRNRQRASWSLAIPYDNELNETKSFFPDFLIVRHNEDGYVVDILEPHDPNQRDNIGKAKGFANYAKENQISGRLQLIREKKVLGQKIFTRLDMSKAEICDRVCRASSNGELDSIFDSLGQA